MVEERGYDKRRYNIPIADEVAAVILGDDHAFENTRNLVVYLKQSGEHSFDVLRTIQDTSCLYAPLHYILLFPYREDGYSINLILNQTENTRHKKMSQLEYYAFQLHSRVGIDSLILRGGRLFQQYLVDI